MTSFFDQGKCEGRNTVSSGGDVRDRRLHGTPIDGDFTVPRLSPGLTTDELAALLGIQAQSVRKRYCETGSYFGLRPIKLGNRRLRWNASAVEKFLQGEVA
ncbi:helix-turn-helix domain-containing protein [Burkholderia multivorans]|uniref:helix-turn-helix transcriptional regulator n=1 Tax=Burkholderia multivorans TaxID=87883 RepID=UPI002018703E|nr:helix-turn-helix domain-containing protein [Burkholderia multivorans]UQO99566.1 helix-turn-helix domain-containing protein [Burkholderia multivorans]